MPKVKLYYISYLRVFATMLVSLFPVVLLLMGTVLSAFMKKNNITSNLMGI